MISSNPASSETVFSNAQVVTRDAVFAGSLLVRDGVITRVDHGSSNTADVDLGGDYLLPGLIEMHTDNMEKHFEPRPGVLWPAPTASVIMHDVQIAGAGITTVYDSVCVGIYGEDSMRSKILDDTVNAVRETSARDLLRAEHILHLRCEICDPDVTALLDRYIDEPMVRLLSVMDHTPGQRQWQDLSKYRLYNRSKGWTDAEFESHIADLKEQAARHSDRNRASILAMARDRGIAVASHDDTTAAHVEQAHDEGIAISEFPTTVVAAERARALGLGVIMGAPNLVRGGSHSGNVSTQELAERDLVDGLSSDYVPASLLHASFLLHQRAGQALPDAVGTVSYKLADLLGLDDRGAIEEGRRADLIHVSLVDDIPVVRAVWRGGARVI